MRTRDLDRLGIPKGAPTQAAIQLGQRARELNLKRAELLARLAEVVKDPEAFRDHTSFGGLALALIEQRVVEESYERDEPAPYRQWGVDLEPQSVEQMKRACELPVSVRGALMPDAHLGYGLPIGGVLATRAAVIPYAVGVDIACRMKLSVLDLPLDVFDRSLDPLKRAIEDETRFGIGANFKRPRTHEVLDRDWSVTGVTAHLKDKAWKQLGTSGSGNHFVEFGILTITDDETGLPAGDYVALLSHSGSRGAGASVASHYSQLAMKLHPQLGDRLKHLAWLDLDSEEGREYWEAMNLMGEYAAANHACIHKHVARHLGVEVLLDVENHHNFAWKEEHDGEELIVHRKGATPAGKGVLGIIPGSMADNAYIVRGEGNPESLNSAAHGAGRVMSRKKAKNSFNWSEVNTLLSQRGVTLMSAGLDEVPMVYKNIEEVMSHQSDLVTPLARFAPKLVKMAPAGERPED